MNGICERKNCFGHDEKYDNNCYCLRETYDDDMKCPFFKTPEELNEQRQKLRLRFRR